MSRCRRSWAWASARSRVAGVTRWLLFSSAFEKAQAFSCTRQKRKKRALACNETPVCPSDTGRKDEAGANRCLIRRIFEGIYPFTAPAVRPVIRVFWPTMKTTTKGIITTTVPAMMTP